MGRLVRLLAVLAACSAASLPCAAESMWDLEAVDSNGLGTHPKVNADAGDPSNRVTVEGVALAGSSEILDPGPPAAMGIQYTLFVQDDTSDRGGMQAWAGSWFYGEPMWSMVRQSDYVDVSAGDRVRITGFLQDAERGKVVINHRHSNNPDLIFTMEVIGHPGLPDPVLIPSVSHCNYFDQARAGGGEFYQTRFVMLHGVDVTAATWENGSMLTIEDGTGSVGMLLSAMGDFTGQSQPEGKLNVVGIFDQEDTTVPCTEDYRVWVKRQSDVAPALDCCRQVRPHDAGEVVALAAKVVSRAYPGFFYVQDQERTGGLRVVSDRTVVPGDRVCVHGQLTNDGSEKVMLPTYLILESGAAPEPLGVTSRELWRQDGLDLRGLLVRCVCKLGAYQGDYIYSLTDDAGKTIYLQTYGGASLPEPGTRVVVNAALSESGGVPFLFLSTDADVETLD